MLLHRSYYVEPVGGSASQLGALLSLNCSSTLHMQPHGSLEDKKEAGFTKQGEERHSGHMTGITPTRSHDGRTARTRPSVVHDAQVARYDFVLQHGASWDVDPVSVVSDDDDSALGGRGDTTVSLKSGFICGIKADSKISSRR